MSPVWCPSLCSLILLFEQVLAYAGATFGNKLICCCVFKMFLKCSLYSSAGSILLHQTTSCYCSGRVSCCVCSNLLLQGGADRTPLLSSAAWILKTAPLRKCNKTSLLRGADRPEAWFQLLLTTHTRGIRCVCLHQWHTHTPADSHTYMQPRIHTNWRSASCCRCFWVQTLF